MSMIRYVLEFPVESGEKENFYVGIDKKPIVHAKKFDIPYMSYGGPYPYPGLYWDPIKVKIIAEVGEPKTAYKFLEWIKSFCEGEGKAKNMVLLLIDPLGDIIEKYYLFNCKVESEVLITETNIIDEPINITLHFDRSFIEI